MKAWVEHGRVRDVCFGNPEETYHPDIAQLYSTDVPDHVKNGAMLVAGVWVNLTPSEPSPVPSASLVPSAVTMRQARIALLAAGLLGDVDTAIAALPSPAKERARIEWEYSNEVLRANGVVAQLGPLLGLSSTQIDALFIEADKL